MANSVEIEVTALSTDGRGIGRVGERAVFVRGSVPGDRLLVDVDESVSPVSGNVRQLISPSPYRCLHPCVHHRECVGSLWGGIEYTEQLRQKRQLIRHTLRSVVSPDLIREVHPSPKTWNYRNRISLRTWVDGRFLRCGMMSVSRTATGTPIHECKLADEAVEALLSRIARHLSANEWPSELPIPIRIQLHRTLSGAGMMLVFQRSISESVLSRIVSYFQDSQARGLTTIIGNRAGVPDGRGATFSTSNTELLFSDWMGKPFNVHPAVFCQANSGCSDEAVKWVRLNVATREYRQVWDLYGGYGPLGFAACRASSQLNIFEMNPLARSFAIELQKRNPVANMKFILGDVAQEISRVKRQISAHDLVILDPPRSGAHERVLLAIAESKATSVLYVSCNTAKFGRDAKILSSHAFRIEQIQPFDFFPHTPNVELFCVLSRN